MTYCFYAVMGGFTVEFSQTNKAQPRKTLTHVALRENVDLGHFFLISSDAIEDKSKADLLAKGLAICQISWLVVQSIARAHQHLPLTLLEIHTMIHVVSALLMYLCWWRKPKDVNSATVIDPTEALSTTSGIDELHKDYGVVDQQLEK
jgi:hypothetical protein